MNNKIKVIPHLEPWQVMKRASEGESVANRRRHSRIDNGIVIWSSCDHPNWDWRTGDYAIIDTTAPQIQWEEFDYEFFNQYGGVKTAHVDEPTRKYVTKITPAIGDDLVLRESPLYYWPGGKCPVPGNVEVDVVIRYTGDIGDLIAHSSKLDWGHGNVNRDIIAFRITGNVL